jgi:hypothetical protein
LAAEPPGPAQAGFIDAPPGPVHKDSPNDAKIVFFRALFGARTDIYATRIENSRTGWKGWLPAVRGGWQRGIPREVTRLAAPVSTMIRPEAATLVRARLGAGIRVELADLTPALAASLRHAASMHNPQFYEKQRMRASTWDIPGSCSSPTRPSTAG